jgi:hypothetical protein
MKAMFGVVSLLVALAIVGLVAVKQLKAVGKVGSSASAPASVDGAAVPQMSGSGSVAQQSRDLRNQVAGDIAKAMNQGAAARREETDKP